MIRALVACALLLPACTPQTVPARSDLTRDLASWPDVRARCGSTVACPGGEACLEGDCVPEQIVWPNSVSRANSDPWLPEHHRQIRQLQPRILALNYVNARTNAEMLAHLQQIIDALVESSRFHGYDDPAAVPMMRPQIAYAVDLRDNPPPRTWTLRNSTLYPREAPVKGSWGFAYGQLFGAALAQRMGIADPADPSRVLDLCQLIDRGLVHEVWIYGDADVPDVSAAEILENKPVYGIDRVRRDDKPMNRCAGNGCFDVGDVPESCTRTVRVGWVNNTRGPGCFVESLSHGFESIGSRQALIPYLTAHLEELGGFDLDRRYQLPFASWYSCAYGASCLTYPSRTSVSYDVKGVTGTVQGYDPVCGNVHFAPNARSHYDLKSPETVDSSCEGYRLRQAGGKDATRAFTVERFARYATLAPDCQGKFLVYWRQNFPGFDSQATGIDGQPMLSWLPFVYY
jgi:hypothetical protein